MNTRRVLGAAAFAFAVVTAGACYDFNAAVDRCQQTGRCASDDGGVIVPEDGGTEDAGPTDSGQPDDGGMDEDAGLDAGEDAGTGNCAEGFSLAKPFQVGGWEWEHPLPQGNPLHAVSGWGDKVWAGGNDGVLMEIDDCRIRQLALPVSTAIRGIGARGPDDFVVVGDTGANFTFTEGVRQPLLSAHFNPTDSLRTVGMGPGTALYALNQSGTGPFLYVETDTTGLSAVGPRALSVISAAGLSSRWWAIGTDERAYLSDQLVPNNWTEHLDGGPAWHDVWVANRDQEAWIAGADGGLWSSNGFTSQQQGTPGQFLTPAGKAADLVAVWGAQKQLTPSQDVYAVVSAQGNLFRRVGEPGTPWTEITRPGGGSFLRGDAYEDVWVRPFTPVGGQTWAVGEGGAIVTDAVGGTWQEVTAWFSNAGREDLNGIDGVAGKLFAVSDSKVLERTAEGRWRPMSPQPAGVTTTLRDVVALSADHLFVFGDDTTILEYVNDQWVSRSITGLSAGTFMPGDTQVKLQAASSADRHSIWVVGFFYPPASAPAEGFAATWNDTTDTWTEVEAGAKPLTQVSAQNANDAWAVGDDTVVKINKTTTVSYPVTGRKFESIHARATGTITVGGQGFIGTFATGTPATVTDALLPDGGTLQNQNFWDVTLSTDGPLFVGGSGAAMVLDGGTVYPIASGTTNVLRGVYVNLTSGTAWVVGDHATVLRQLQ